MEEQRIIYRTHEAVHKKHPLRFMSYICLLSFAFSLLLVSCKDKATIPEDDFISILTDMYLSKAYFSAEGIYQARLQDTIPYNRHIVDRYGYQWAQFDSTVSWYCTKPKQYQEVYEEVIARLSQIEERITAELDPPSELWTGKTQYYLPIDGKQDTVPVDVLLKGNGSYVVKAKIRVYPGDKSFNPHSVLYLWRSDTTTLGVRDTIYWMPLRKDGLMLEYSFEKTLLPGNEFTHLKGNWLQHDRNDMDTTWSKRAEITDISVYHIPKNFK